MAVMLESDLPAPWRGASEKLGLSLRSTSSAMRSEMCPNTVSKRQPSKQNLGRHSRVCCNTAKSCSMRLSSATQMQVWRSERPYFFEGL